MKTYPIPMVPGPVKLSQTVLDVYQTNFGSADLEAEFLELYNRTESNLKMILSTKNRVVIQSGEGMLALWSALKSCLLSGDRVLAVATGVFGDGIGDMALSIGADVNKIRLPYNETISDMSEIEAAIVQFKPKMITAVHCETPSGTLNPIAELGRLKQRYNVPLLYVDAVASAGGAPVLSDEWNIDLCLGGSQKCLSSLPDMAFLSVSESAWDIIHNVNYVGYDALKPFYKAQAEHYFPYTPNWQGVAGLNAGAELILNEGLINSYARHGKVSEFCRNKIIDMGLSLFPASDAVPSPTVTAVNVPEGVNWPEFNLQLRQHGLVVGGSYGPMAGKVFRLGHMGTQADMELVKQALNVIEIVVEKI
ncbi:MAG: aminotransferase class V-fold PLP-dependent enzyme [Desulfobacteraceae bacterium]|nr:aminotransferase class V-fold PLP-dependent enzyme [Desulfobacteraceae bacterium]